MDRTFIDDLTGTYYPIPISLGNAIPIDVTARESFTQVRGVESFRSIRNSSKNIDQSGFEVKGNKRKYEFHCSKDKIEQRTIERGAVLRFTDLAEDKGVSYDITVNEKGYIITASRKIQNRIIKAMNLYLYTDNIRIDSLNKMIDYDSDRLINYVSKIDKYDQYVYLNPFIDMRYIYSAHVDERCNEYDFLYISNDYKGSDEFREEFQKFFKENKPSLWDCVMKLFK